MAVIILSVECNKRQANICYSHSRNVKNDCSPRIVDSIPRSGKIENYEINMSFFSA